MKTALFAYRTVGYECAKYLTEDGDETTFIIPAEDKGTDGTYKSTKKMLVENNIPFFQPKNLRGWNKLRIHLESIDPDIAFSCYYPNIIPMNILSLFHLGGLNIHGGILPNYRGTFSGVWSIINDEKESGVTLHFMEEKVDLGDIVEIRKCTIQNDDTGKSLYERISIISIALFKKYYKKIKNREPLERILQDASEGKYYSRKLPHGGLIDWGWDDRKIYNFCRACNYPPYKGAVSKIAGRDYEILDVKQTYESSNMHPGTIVKTSKNGITVSTNGNDIFINCLKFDGNVIAMKDFINNLPFTGNKFE